MWNYWNKGSLEQDLEGENIGNASEIVGSESGAVDSEAGGNEAFGEKNMMLFLDRLEHLSFISFFSQYWTLLLYTL